MGEASKGIPGDIPIIDDCKNTFKILSYPFYSSWIIRKAWNVKYTDSERLEKKAKALMHTRKDHAKIKYFEVLVYMGCVIQEAIYEYETSHKIKNYKKIKEFCAASSHPLLSISNMHDRRKRKLNDKERLEWGMFLKDLLLALDTHMHEFLACVKAQAYITYEEFEKAFPIQEQSVKRKNRKS